MDPRQMFIISDCSLTISRTVAFIRRIKMETKAEVEDREGDIIIKEAMELVLVLEKKSISPTFVN